MGEQARRLAARRRAAGRMVAVALQRSAGTDDVVADTQDPRTSRCPRCDAAVTYRGRGRRPVWCSARCRVEASIERRGNRMVGVEPRIVEVVRSREVSLKPTIAAWPIQPATPALGRRQAEDWMAMLDDLRRALSTGAVYDREMTQLIEPLNGVLEAFQRRSRRH